MKKEENEAISLLEERRKELKRRLLQIESVLRLARDQTRNDENEGGWSGPTASDAVQEVLSATDIPMTGRQICKAANADGIANVSSASVHTALNRLKKHGKARKVSEGPPATWMLVQDQSAIQPNEPQPSFGQTPNVRLASS